MYMQRDAAIENQYVIGLYNQANNTLIAQLLLRNGSWRLWYLSTGTTNAYADYASTPAANTTYLVEIYAKISSTEGQVIVYIDETARITTAATLDNDNYGGVQTLRVGIYATGGTGNSNTVIIDAVKVSDSYIGPETSGMQLLCLHNAMGY